MTKRLPILALKKLAKEYGLRQVIVIAQNADDTTVHVATYGRSIEDCKLAAESGNHLKRHMGWPDDLCNEVPARLRRGNHLIEANAE